MKAFRTDRRLWFWISLGLFVVPWFLPVLGGKGSEHVAPWHFWWFLFTYPSHLLETLGGLTLLSAVFGVPAMAVGWVAQAAVVIARQKRTRP